MYRMIFWTWQATNPNILQTWPCVYKLVHPLYLLLCPPKMNWGLPPRLLLLLLFLLRPQKLNWTIQAWSWRILTVGIRMCKLYIVSIVDIACVIFDLRLLLIHTMGHIFFFFKKKPRRPKNSWKEMNWNSRPARIFIRTRIWFPFWAIFVLIFFSSANIQIALSAKWLSQWHCC